VTRRTFSLDEETDRIVLRFAQDEDGNLSRGIRRMAKAAQGNHQSIRHALRGLINAASLNCRLVRSGIHTPGVLGFVGEIEKAVQEMEKVVAKGEG
jgi:hypothetical protein